MTQFPPRAGWLLWFGVAATGFCPPVGRPAGAAQGPKERARLGGHTAVVTSVAITADGKTLASGGYDQTVKLWDVATGKEVAALKGRGPIALTPDGKTLATGGENDTVKL